LHAHAITSFMCYFARIFSARHVFSAWYDYYNKILSLENLNIADIKAIFKFYTLYKLYHMEIVRFSFFMYAHIYMCACMHASFFMLYIFVYTFLQIFTFSTISYPKIHIEDCVCVIFTWNKVYLINYLVAYVFKILWTRLINFDFQITP
jgi:hypothetical protein